MKTTSPNVISSAVEKSLSRQPILKGFLHSLRSVEMTLGILVFLLWPLSSAHALYVYGPTTHFGMNAGSQPLGDITFRADSGENLFTAAKGIDLYIDDYQWILWEKDVTAVQISGNAVERGKMAAETAVRYSTNLKILHIPVLADWAEGDEMVVSGLKVRLYDRASSPQAIRIDVNGDGVMDYDSAVTVGIDGNDVRTDRTPAYPPSDFTAAVLQNPWRVALSWQSPPDYDWTGIELFRVSGPSETLLLSGGAYETFTDTEVSEGQEVTYRLYSVDRHGNRSGAASITRVIQSASEESPPSTPEGDSEGDSSSPSAPLNDTSAEEQSLLTRLFSYYGIRYSIKCLPASRTVSWGDSACLWAKIDLVYSQTRLNRSDTAVSLGEQDLGLIARRLPYSEDRYQANCMGVAPAAYCPALNRAILRAQYLLNQ